MNMLHNADDLITIVSNGVAVALTLWIIFCLIDNDRGGMI